MANVRGRPVCMLSQRLIVFPVYSRRWEERPLVRSACDISVSMTYSVVQCVDYRGRRWHAEAGTRITRIFLL